MMILTGCTKVIKITALATSRKSGKSAHGVIYLPYESYQMHKTFIDHGIQIVVPKLDDESSRHMCLIAITEMNIEDIIHDTDTTIYNSSFNVIDEIYTQLFIKAGLSITSMYDFNISIMNYIDSQKPLTNNIEHLRSMHEVRSEIVNVLNTMADDTSKYNCGKIDKEAYRIATIHQTSRLTTLRWVMNQEIK